MMTNMSLARIKCLQTGIITSNWNLVVWLWHLEHFNFSFIYCHWNLFPLVDVIFSEVEDEDYDSGEMFDLEDDSEDTEVKVYAIGNRYIFQSNWIVIKYLLFLEIS